MKFMLTILSLMTFGFSAFAGSSAVLQGKVQGATGYLARAGYTDCQVIVSAESQDSMTVDFELVNAKNGAKLELSDLNLTKEGRVGVLEKMIYDLGVRTAPQAIPDSSIVPQAYLQYNNLIKVKNGGAQIDYHFSELRTNGEFYGATSSLVCRTQEIQ